jgi:hypothetical protein
LDTGRSRAQPAPPQLLVQPPVLVTRVGGPEGVVGDGDDAVGDDPAAERRVGSGQAAGDLPGLLGRVPCLDRVGRANGLGREADRVAEVM